MQLNAHDLSGQEQRERLKRERSEIILLVILWFFMTSALIGEVFLVTWLLVHFGLAALPTGLA